MCKDILNRIIEVENEIRGRLEIEKRKAIEWVEKVKKDAEEEVEREEEGLKDSFNKAEADAKAEAERKAAETLESVTKWAEGLGKLNDETLKEVIMRHIIKVLPGESNDSQNVKG